MSPSDHQVDALDFAATAPEPVWRRELSVPRLLAIASVGIILVLAAIDAGLRGPWLDEFWTLELADTRDGLLALIRDGWLRDSHPPAFSAWATLLGSVGVTSIPGGRLVSNLLAAGLMILAAWRLSRRLPEQAGFNLVLLLLTLSLPQAMESFAVYRSYFWQIAAIGSLAMVARYIASTRVDLDWRKDTDLIAIAVTSTAASIGLHYIGGVFGGLLAGAIALLAWRHGLRRWAVLMLATAALATLFISASVLLQMPAWAAEFDHSWIDLPGVQAVGVPIALAVSAICHNPVPLAGFFFGRSGRRDGELSFAMLIVGALVAGIAIILAGHAFKPIMVDRYLFAVPVLVCALMAIPAARVLPDHPLIALLAVVSVAVAATPLIRDGIKPMWREDAQTIARIAAECPTTQVYAASGWALGPAAETRTARREDPVFARAYRLLADGRFAVSFIGQNGVARAMPGACPVLLWIEHTPNNAEDDLREAVQEAGLPGLQESRLSATRSATGFVVRADRP